MIKNSIVQYIEENDELKTLDEILFFGGSFNPWHNGHSSCIKLCPLDKKIIVIPDHNPFKEVIKSTEKNTSLIEIKNILKNFQQTTYLFDTFYKLEQKNPTSHWINEIKEAFPKIKLSLLMGFDSFASIDKWIDASILINNLYSLYVASRQDNPQVMNAQIETLKDINPSLHITFLGKHEYEDLSSTKLRSLNSKS